jgi:hypothetical protein
MFTNEVNPQSLLQNLGEPMIFLLGIDPPDGIYGGSYDLLLVYSSGILASFSSFINIDQSKTYTDRKVTPFCFDDLPTGDGVFLTTEVQLVDNSNLEQYIPQQKRQVHQQFVFTLEDLLKNAGFSSLDELLALEDSCFEITTPYEQ